MGLPTARFPSRVALSIPMLPIAPECQSEDQTSVLSKRTSRYHTATPFQPYEHAVERAGHDHLDLARITL
jgi:hypothetical protein